MPIDIKGLLAALRTGKPSPDERINQKAKEDEDKLKAFLLEAQKISNRKWETIPRVSPTFKLDSPFNRER
jgi:hypothetical protein